MERAVPEKVNLADAFGRVSALWTPHVAGELNGQYVKLARVKGSFVWHAHEAEDELFLVVKGTLTIHLRARDGETRSVVLREGEFVIVPRGVEHRPEAEGEAHVLLFEPASTAHTGDVESPLTVRTLPRL